VIALPIPRPADPPTRKHQLGGPKHSDTVEELAVILKDWLENGIAFGQISPSLTKSQSKKESDNEKQRSNRTQEVPRCGKQGRDCSVLLHVLLESVVG
jgi:hypothetical protein